MEMNPEVKKKWIEALRSGEYKQGYTCLNNKGKYCCLGVLCEIASREGITNKQCVEDFPELFSYGDHTSVLPVVVQEWSGLHTTVPYVIYYGNNIYITELNDYKKLTFNEIANIIERQL